MIQPTKVKYHSTSQFRNVVKFYNDQAKFGGIAGDGSVIINSLGVAPIVEYIGTTKLHGTNGSIILHEDGMISFHSKNSLLGYVVDGEFTLLSDNAEFAQSMFRRFDTVMEIMERARIVSLGVNGTELWPIKVSGEWCGQGIQSNVGIAYLPKKSFFIFGMKGGETCDKNIQGWLPVPYTYDLVQEGDNLSGFYTVMDFPTKSISIDFSNAINSQNSLVSATDEVEKECPVASKLGTKSSDGTPEILGEGLVWTPVEYGHCFNSGTWFKTKGEKHSVSKTKSVAAVCPEKLASTNSFVEYAVTRNRLEQGLGEVGLDQKLIGTFIGWVNKDINKEEGDVLEKSNLTMKDVGKGCSTKARNWYIGKLQEV